MQFFDLEAVVRQRCQHAVQFGQVEINGSNQVLRTSLGMVLQAKLFCMQNHANPVVTLVHCS